MQNSTLPEAVGVGLRAPHYADFLEGGPKVPWLEAHSENYFGGGAPLNTLLRIREHYPMSLHGVGLGLASPDPLDMTHVKALRQLIDQVQPLAVSEHLSWNRIDGKVINDLLPFAYTQEALLLVRDRVDQLQQALGRQVLLENLSSYVSFARQDMSEATFLAELVSMTGCGLLLDVNNIYVNERNLGIDARGFIDTLPLSAVGEIHLAGFSEMEECLVDTHSRPVTEEVWALYHYALERCGKTPTLVEWDIDIPPLPRLLEEAQLADRYLQACGGGHV